MKGNTNGNNIKFDNTPTEYSDNAVTSGSVFSAIEDSKCDELFSGKWNSQTSKTLENLDKYRFLIFYMYGDNTNYSINFDLNSTAMGGCAPAFDNGNPSAIHAAYLLKNGSTFSFASIGFFNGATVWNSRKFRDSDYYGSYYCYRILGVK